MVPSGTRSEPGPPVLGVVADERGGEFWIVYVRPSSSGWYGGYYKESEIEVLREDGEELETWRQTPSR